MNSSTRSTAPELMPAPLMSVLEAAEILCCSRGQMINLVAKDHFRDLDIGIGRAKTRVYPMDRQASIDSRTRGSTD